MSSNNRKEKENKNDSFVKDVLKKTKEAHRDIKDVFKFGKEVVDIFNEFKDIVPTIPSIILPKKYLSEDALVVNKGIIELIEDLADDYYQVFKAFCSEFIVFNYLDDNNIDKDIFIEKVLDYIETYHIKNNVNYKDVLQNYVNCLLPAISSFDKKGGREEKYFNKAEEIVNELKKDSKYDFEKAKDFTRIFVSLYVSRDEKREFDFDLTKDKINETIKRLRGTKSYKALFQNGRTSADMNIKYHKFNFVDMLLILLYLNMLSNRSESELD